MLPSHAAFSPAPTKMPSHHPASFANGYPRGNTFDISPHRYLVDGLAALTTFWRG